MLTPEPHTPNPWLNIGLIVVLFVVMYFLIIRPQMKRQKEQKQMIESLQKGDEIVTIGGVVGKITQMNEGFLMIAISHNVEIQIQKTAIASVLPKGTLKLSA